MRKAKCRRVKHKPGKSVTKQSGRLNNECLAIHEEEQKEMDPYDVDTWD